jgi:hypothetical protein
MSKIENPKKVLKKTLFLEVSDDNALKIKKMLKKKCDDKFLYIL